MTSNEIYLTILVIVGTILLTELPNIISNFVVSDIILTLYISYLIKAFFIYPASKNESYKFQEH